MFFRTSYKKFHSKFHLHVKGFFGKKTCSLFSKVIPLAPSYKFWPISWRFGMLDKDFQDVHWCFIETPQVHLVTSCRWVQMEVAHLFWNQSCNQMIIALARSQHIFFPNTYLYFLYCKGISSWCGPTFGLWRT
jgi:hypothetical protein